MLYGCSYDRREPFRGDEHNYRLKARMEAERREVLDNPESPDGELFERFGLSPDSRLCDLIHKLHERSRGLPPVHGIYSPPEAQIVRIYELYHDHGFYGALPWRSFLDAVRSMPNDWPGEWQTIVTLVPRLREDRPEVPARTFRLLWSLLDKAYSRGRGADDAMLLSDGLKSARPPAASGLAWETIDFGASPGETPDSVMPDRAPDAGVLASALLHPEWFRAVGQEAMIPGYSVMSASRDGAIRRMEAHSPAILFSRQLKRPILKLMPRSKPCAGRALLPVPRFFGSGGQDTLLL